MSALTPVLDHLRALVRFDTRNPPRAIDKGGIFAYLSQHLPGFRLDLRDHGAGSVSLFAERGSPRLLFNIHLDTVPSAPGWSHDPFDLVVTGDRAFGLGACDIKGAAACLLDVVNRMSGDSALLFTSDEEANDARAVEAFLAEEARLGPRFDAVIVAEPTRCRAITAHRGIGSARVIFRGSAGHASGERALAESAIHRAIRWGSRALTEVERRSGETFGELRGLRFNIGRMEGGIKANVIAPMAEVRFGFRPLPSTDVDALLKDFHALAEEGAIEIFEETFRGPPLPAGDPAESQAKRDRAAALATSLGLDLGPAVDFWTEASLFSRAGLPAIVLGPGDIAQAHAVDEHVTLDDLRAAVGHYERIVGS